MNRVTGSIKKMFASLLSTVPERTKRMVFLVSFSARLSPSNELDPETLDKLNKVMALCDDNRAMGLPNYLSKVIWNGKTAYEICNQNVCGVRLDQETMQRITGRVKSSMPGWLQYGSDEAIQKDVELLLSNKTPLLGV